MLLTNWKDYGGIGMIMLKGIVDHCSPREWYNGNLCIEGEMEGPEKLVKQVLKDIGWREWNMTYGQTGRL